MGAAGGQREKGKDSDKSILKISSLLGVRSKCETKLLDMEKKMHPCRGNKW